MINILLEKIDEFVWISHNLGLLASWSGSGAILKGIDNFFIKPCVDSITYHEPFHSPIFVIVKKVI